MCGSVDARVAGLVSGQVSRSEPRCVRGWLDGLSGWVKEWLGGRDKKAWVVSQSHLQRPRIPLFGVPFRLLLAMASLREIKDLARLTASGPDAPHMPAINRSGASLVPVPASGSVSRGPGPIVPAKPASVTDGRVSASGQSDEEDEDALPDNVDTQTECSEHKRPLGRDKQVKHFTYAVDGCDLKCKMCGIACTEQSPTAVYDLADFQGFVPWRSYQTVNQVRNEDGSLTLLKKKSPPASCAGSATRCTST